MSVVTVTTTTVVVSYCHYGYSSWFRCYRHLHTLSALIAKELSGSYEGPERTVKERLKSLLVSLNIEITPMLMIFALIVAVKVLEVLGT